VLKVSRYLVVSDREYVDGDGGRVRLAFSTRTGRIVPLAPSAAADLAGGRVGELPPPLHAALRDAEILVPREQDELTHVLAENRTAVADPAIVKFTLLPSSYCNMGCEYCGQQHSRGGLSAGHRDQVRSRVLRRMAQSTTRTVQIDWFGAEPLMGYPMIVDLSRDFVAQAARDDLDYYSAIVTNGTLLTLERVGVLARDCRISHFEITLDGPPDVHDAHRPLKAGGGSFWRIVKTIQKAIVDSDFQSVAFQFRTNVGHLNQDRITEYLQMMGDLGFARHNVSFSLAPIHSWGNDVSRFEVERRRYADLEVRWLELMRRRGMRFAVLPSGRRKAVCGAVHRNTEYISSTGNVFSCSEFPLVPGAEKEKALGNVNQRDLPLARPAGQFDDWNDQIAAGASWCSGCVFLPVCGGACPKAWSEGNPPCPSYKFNLQRRLDLAATGAGLHPAEPVGVTDAS
jgi:uncharacterized protein